MRSQLAGVICATVAFATASAPAPAAGEIHEQLTSLAHDIVYTEAAMFPTQATQLGIAGHDGELETPSEQNRNAYIDKLQQWQKRLELIAPAGRPDITLVDRNDARLLGAQLTRNLNQLQVRNTDRKDYSAGANNIVNTIFVQLQFLPAAGREGRTAADVNKAWTDLTNRIRKAPQYIKASQTLVTEPGHLYGVVGSQQLEGAASFFNGALTDAAKVHYAGDTKSLTRFTAARDATLAALARTKSYIDEHVAHGPRTSRWAGRLRCNVAGRATAAARFPRRGADGERRARTRLGRGSVADCPVETRQTALRSVQRRRHGA